MASPGSRKTRCMSITSSAVLPGASLSAASKASVRSTMNSDSATLRAVSSDPCRIRTIDSTLGDFSSDSPGPLPVRTINSARGLPSAVPRTSNSALGDFSSGPSGPYRIRTINSALGSPSAHLELPCPHGKGVGDVADGLDPALVVDDDGDHVEAAGLLAETLRAQIALSELAELVLLACVHGGLGRRRILQIAPGLDLDEDEGLALFRHQVDLAHARSDVLLQNGVPAAAQEAGRLILPLDARKLSCVSRHGSLLVRNDGKQVLL